MAKKQPFFDFFRFSQKLSIRFERNFPQLFYTILESYMCNGIKIVWLRCEKHSQNYPKNGQKTAIFRLFSIFSKTVHTIRTKASQKEKDLSRLLYRICGSGFKFVFIEALLNFTRNETSCERKELLNVFGTMRLTGDLRQKNYSENFENFFPQFSAFFKGFPLRKMGFSVVSSWGRMVFETYAYPFGYFLGL